MSAPFIDDPDFTLWVGDVGEILPRLEPGSVDCVITSPPYWGLRDYGTGAWNGGDPDCDHKGSERYYTEKTAAVSSAGAFSEPGEANKERLKKGRWREKGVCRNCGATRRDQQLGLEPTPDEYVRNMVAVFREVRRVLAPHGTCWVNLGDSYAGGGRGGGDPTIGERNLGGSAYPAALVPSGLRPKDLVGIPWRTAFALQADGWYLRADIVWSKPNPMPESVTDRPTKAHEYVFLLTKQPRYFFDAEAVREPHAPHTLVAYPNGPGGSKDRRSGSIPGQSSHRGLTNAMPHNGRNVRSVWEIATQPYPEAHFATYPEELVRRCLLAGCPEWVCRTCGKPRERIVARADDARPYSAYDGKGRFDANGIHERRVNPAGGSTLAKFASQTLGWSDCGHDDYRPGVVLDPFLGSGTTALVARQHGRACVGIELNPAYAELAAKRLQQLSLLAEGIA